MSKLDSKRIEALAEVDVDILPETEWVGEVGPERKEVKIPDTVRWVYLNLTPEDWYSIATREGGEYIGGCCGNMGLLQDRIQEVFRDGGGLDGGDLLMIGKEARAHGDFEDFEKYFVALEDDKFRKAIADWEDNLIGPWAKIGLVFATVEKALKPKSYDVGRYSKEPEHDSVHMLPSLLRQLNWNELITSEKPGHEAQNLLLKARVLEPLQKLLGALEASGVEFEGYALIDPDTYEPMITYAGPCLYATEKEAKETTSIWARSKNPPPCLLAQIRISVAKGLEIINDDRVAHLTPFEDQDLDEPMRLIPRPCVQDREGLWHIMLGEFDDLFTRIVCGQQSGKGINLPGPDEVRIPTCPSCVASEEERLRAV